MLVFPIKQSFGKLSPSETQAVTIPHSSNRALNAFKLVLAVMPTKKKENLNLNLQIMRKRAFDIAVM